LVISQDYPYLRVRITLRSYQSETLAYIDTGFDGHLIMPTKLAQEVGKPDYISRWELGDGSLTEGADYVGDVEIVGLPDNIEARITAIGNEFILGRAIIDRYRLILDHGKSVQVER
jgi:predicted aspartyl protease